MHNRRNLQNVFGIFLPTWNPSWHFLNPSWPDHMSDSFLQQSTLTNYVKPVQIRSKILYIYELNCILWTNSYWINQLTNKIFRFKILIVTCRISWLADKIISFMAGGGIFKPSLNATDIIAPCKYRITLTYGVHFLV